MDCTYNYYLNGQRVIEEHDGSDNLLKQHVWGLGYVDEAVQTAINSDPTNSKHQPLPTCDQPYWLCQDANYNVLGVVDSTGTLRERYEYSAYGQRQVFTSAGSNDPGCYSPTTMSTRVVTSGSVVEPYGINDVGHQGLMHDEETGLVYNRARMLNPTLGRFMQEDPLAESESLPAIEKENLYRYEYDNSQIYIDDTGASAAGPTCIISVTQDPDVGGSKGFKVIYRGFRGGCCPQGTIKLVQAIWSLGILGSGTANFDELDTGTKGSVTGLPGGYVEQGWAYEDRMGRDPKRWWGNYVIPSPKRPWKYRDAPSTKAHLEVCAICEKGGAASIVACLPFDFDPNTGDVTITANQSSTPVPHGTWDVAKEQWKGRGGANY